MPSSTFNLQKLQLIRAALRLVGNRRPTTDQENEASQALHLMLKQWDKDGKWVWTESPDPTILTLAVGVESYSPGDSGPPTELAPDILEITRVEIWTGNKPKVDVAILAKGQWQRSDLRKHSGEPVECYFHRGVTAAQNRIHFAPVPASAQQVRYYFRRRIYDFDENSSFSDLPQEWLATIKFALAAELGPEYGLPDNRQAYLDNKSLFLLRKMVVANTEPADPSRAQAEYF